jgi:hypothetical protein
VIILPYHTQSLTRRIAPQFFKSLVTTASKTVVLVADWVLFVIVLVVILCRVEIFGLHNPGYDRFFEALVPFQFPFRLQRQPVLFIIMIKKALRY